MRLPGEEKGSAIGTIGGPGACGLTWNGRVACMQQACAGLHGLMRGTEIQGKDRLAGLASDTDQSSDGMGLCTSSFHACGAFSPDGSGKI